MCTLQVRNFRTNEESLANLKKTLNGRKVDILVLDEFEDAVEDLLGFVKNDGQIAYTGDDKSNMLEVIG